MMRADEMCLENNRPADAHSMTVSRSAEEQGMHSNKTADSAAHSYRDAEYLDAHRVQDGG